MNTAVDEFLAKAGKWQEEMTKLRSIVLDCQLDEDVKWRQPCYTLQGKNIVIIGPFKEYCALLFFKGALLKDPGGFLSRNGNTQAGRQMRFTSLQDIAEREAAVKAYIQEAIEIEEAGLRVEKRTEFPVPEEFQARLDEDPVLRAAFAGLTPGRQRAYLHHFSEPKQSTTRASRVEKWIPQILAGRGLNDA